MNIWVECALKKRKSIEKPDQNKKSNTLTIEDGENKSTYSGDSTTSKFKGHPNTKTCTRERLNARTHTHTACQRKLSPLLVVFLWLVAGHHLTEGTHQMYQPRWDRTTISIRHKKFSRQDIASIKLSPRGAKPCQTSTHPQRMARINKTTELEKANRWKNVSRPDWSAAFHLFMRLVAHWGIC